MVAKLGFGLVLAALFLTGGAALAEPGPANSLTITAHPSPIVWQHVVHISGKLLGPNAGNQTVHTFMDGFPFDRFTPATQAFQTEASGSYFFNQDPEVNSRYQVRSGSVQSPIITVLVRSSVSLRLSDTTPLRGHDVGLAGRVCPHHNGSLVSIQRQRRNGRYRTVAHARLSPASKTSLCSHYRRDLRLFRGGRFRVVAQGHGGYATGLSRVQLADVHR